MGRYQPGDDGCYVATLWATLIFVPIWPISSWLVIEAEEGGWYFLGRTPMVPSLRRIRGIVSRAAFLAMAVGAWMLFHHYTHLDVHALNGFDVPVVVSVGDRSATLAPRQHHTFEGVPAGETTFSARLPDAAEPLERHIDELPAFASETVVYNVHGRAVLSLDFVRYGAGQPPEGRLLPADPVLHLPSVDYLFTTPPEQKQVREDSFVQNTTLQAIDTGASASQVASYLIAGGRTPQALAVGRAELSLHPDDASLAWVMARVGLEGDPDAGRALLRDCLERAPESLDLHRFYQELWPPGEREALIAEYRARLEAAPDSPREHYLVGRLLEARDAIAEYRRSLELDPEFAPSLRAWAYEAALAGDWATAERLNASYAAASPERALEVLELRLVGARVGRRAAAAVEALLREVEPEAPLVSASWRSRFRVETSPSVLEAAESELDSILREAGVPDPDRLEARLLLRLIAGDLAGARGAIAEGAGTLPSRLVLAMSQGATPEERAAVRPLLAAATPALLWGGSQLLALALAEEEGWEDQAARFEASLARDVDAFLAAALRELPREAEPVQKALARLPPQHRAAASFALAWRVRRSAQGDPAGLARGLEAAARRLSLPGELPSLRPAS
jgi:Arc/MetJ family transcription regulator